MKSSLDCGHRYIGKKSFFIFILTRTFKAHVEVFGSYATDLCLPSSDIDLVVVGAPSGPQGWTAALFLVFVVFLFSY